ncbi:MAG: transcription antitermination factor NusB [Candidatus Pacebacteria bacterium]|nr:transcription antitermination factor NusB [Candidatus Paceibacterota bacterium]
MSNRHLARSIVMQTLFAWDFQARSEDLVEPLIKYTLDEFGAGIEDPEFIANLTRGIVQKRAVLDEIIGKAAPDWPVDKISGVDRNALRIGLYELLFGDRDHVPPKVAINEAIELAKSYGGENSGRFINGVLGAVYREIGEPGKDQVGKKKEDIDLTKLPIEKKGGAVVYSIDGGKIRFVMVHDVFGYWTLSKGGIDDAPDEITGTQREIKDELGLDIEIKTLLGENEYIANHPEKGKIRKQVKYYLAQSPYQTLVLEKGTGGLDDAKWFDIEDIGDLRMYEDVTGMMQQAVEKITSELTAKE